jgi:hypothetical protein
VVFSALHHLVARGRCASEESRAEQCADCEALCPHTCLNQLPVSLYRASAHIETQRWLTFCENV